jgi:molybdopterin synthase sulfur carrier subunit
MHVQVKLFATLRRYRLGPETPFSAKLDPGGTVSDLLAQLGVPQDETQVIFVNGRARPLDWALAPGDEVGIFPPVGGG